MKPVNLLKTAAWAVVIVSLLSIVWILSGIYHHADRKTVRPSAAPVPAPVAMPPRYTVPDARTLQNDFSRIADNDSLSSSI